MAIPYSGHAVETIEIQYRSIHSERQQNFLKYYARVTQFLTWPLLFIVLNFFLRIKIKGRNNFKNIRTPFIIVSNHVAFYDSFMFRLVLGIFTSKLPLRFMAVNKFNADFLNKLASLGIIDFIYGLFGVFVIEPGKGIAKNLEEAYSIIKHRGNVVMYPEGKITNENDTIGTFKIGAAVLAQQTGVPVIFVSMRLGKKHFFRREFTVNVGEVLTVDSHLSNASTTQIFHDKVLELYNQS